MGIIWVAAGTVGIWLSRNEQRSVVPAMVIALTAAAFQVSTTIYIEIPWRLH